MHPRVLSETGLLSEQSNAPLISGLAAAAAMAWLLAPHTHFASVLQIVLVAAVHMGLTVVAGAAGFRISSYVFSRDTGIGLPIVVATASWLAPLAVSLKYNSPLSIPLACIFASAVTATVRSHYGDADIAGASSRLPVFDPQVFHLLDLPPISDVIWLAAAAMILNIAFAFAASGQVRRSALLAGLAFIVITWRAASFRITRRSVRWGRQLLSSWILLSIAFLATVGAIRSQIRGDKSEADSDSVTEPGGGEGGRFQSVYLFPRESAPKEQRRPHITLIAPLVNAPSAGIRVPVRIPFDGVYWFFQWPVQRLSSSAAVMHGVPDEIGFHSTNSMPLWMEAHQTLASPIDITSCRAIDVEVRNADSYPNPVILELILRKANEPQLMSLGAEPIAVRLSLDQRVRRVTLNFPVPERTSVTTFDQITFRFIPDASRRKVSPAIAIEGITLIPR